MTRPPVLRMSRKQSRKLFWPVQSTVTLVRNTLSDSFMPDNSPSVDGKWLLARLFDIFADTCVRYGNGRLRITGGSAQLAPFNEFIEVISMTLVDMKRCTKDCASAKEIRCMSAPVGQRDMEINDFQISSLSRINSAKLCSLNLR